MYINTYKTKYIIKCQKKKNCWWKTVYSKCVWEYFTGISISKHRWN